MAEVSVGHGILTIKSWVGDRYINKETMKPRKQNPMEAGKQGDGIDRAQPSLHQRAAETQTYETVTRDLPLGLDLEIREQIVQSLNQILADTIVLRDLYKKCHWQVSGPTFYQLHLLFDKHAEEQSELVDEIAERIQTLGGIALGMPHDVADRTIIERPPRGREEVPVQISRLLDAHQMLIQQLRGAARIATDLRDDGTNDLLVSSVLRTNETQAWFLYEHVVPMDLVKAK
jgi:starvation-inducible DNA-binding protein